MADYESLRKKYKDFRVPQVAVYVKGQKIDLTKFSLSSAVVDATAENEAAGVCELLFVGVYDPKKSRVDTTLMEALEINQSLEVRMGYGEPSCVFYGKIDEVEIQYNFGEEEGPTLRVNGHRRQGHFDEGPRGPEQKPGVHQGGSQRHPRPVQERRRGQGAEGGQPVAV